MNLKDLWIGILKILSEKIDRTQLVTWFKDTAILSANEGILTVGLPLPVFLNWHAIHFAKPTLQAGQTLDASLKEIQYQVDLTLQGSERAIDITNYFPQNTARKLPHRQEVKWGEGLIGKQLNPRYSLDHFIVAPENRLAHAVCLNVAKYPGQNYNPLFIYGGVGLGKTHLLQGTAQEILRHDPRKVVLYVTSELFVNDVVNFIQTRNMDKFRAKYRKVDALLVDDVQFMANKDRSQEEFFHTFNALYDSGKQIILTSDQPPQQLQLLDARLRSRFEAGMIVDVKMPDFETRLAILQEKCKQTQTLLHQDVLEFIASKATRSIRMLDGVLQQAVAKVEMEHLNPTVNMIAEILQELNPSQEPVGLIKKADGPSVAITLDRLIQCVSDYYTVSKEEVTGESRLRECMVPRQIIMYLAKTRLRLSLAKIGQGLGQRNHTTVMHAVNKITLQLKSDRQLFCDINAITRESGISA